MGRTHQARRPRTWALVAVVLLVGAGPAAGTTLAAFPGGNGKIAFSRLIDPRTVQIHVVDPDGTNVSNLGVSGRDPTWSPDGRRLLVKRCGPGGLADPASCGIWVMNADGTRLTQLTSDRFDVANDEGPSWSPDGKRIAFTRGTRPCFNPPTDEICDHEIYVMNADGAGKTNLTQSGADEADPAWSPDGERIAFTRGMSFVTGTPAPRNLYTMRLDGSDVVQLTDNQDFEKEFGPDWSPDGEKIAFSRLFVDGPDLTLELFTIGRDGGAATRITNRDPGATHPVWSPDGTKIALAPFAIFGAQGIQTVRPDGSDRATLLESSGILDFDWQSVSRPPDCSGITAARAQLWPPNHQFVPISLAGATDPDGDDVSIEVTGVTQDEPVTSQGDNTAPDARGMAASRVELRAERSPKGDGRAYRIAFEATDSRGSTCASSITVSVPRHPHEPAVDSSPPAFDSAS